MSFVGEYLRLFALYPLLLPTWFNLECIRSLLKVVLQTDFNIQGDAIQTVQVSPLRRAALSQIPVLTRSPVPSTC